MLRLENTILVISWLISQYTGKRSLNKNTILCTFEIMNKLLINSPYGFLIICWNNELFEIQKIYLIEKWIYHDTSKRKHHPYSDDHFFLWISLWHYATKRYNKEQSVLLWWSNQVIRMHIKSINMHYSMWEQHFIPHKLNVTDIVD